MIWVDVDETHQNRTQRNQTSIWPVIHRLFQPRGPGFPKFPEPKRLNLPTFLGGRLPCFDIVVGCAHQSGKNIWFANHMTVFEEILIWARERTYFKYKRYWREYDGIHMLHCYFQIQNKIAPNYPIALAGNKWGTSHKKYFEYITIVIHFHNQSKYISIFYNILIYNIFIYIIYC